MQRPLVMILLMSIITGACDATGNPVDLGNQPGRTADLPVTPGDGASGSPSASLGVDFDWNVRSLSSDIRRTGPFDLRLTAATAATTFVWTVDRQGTKYAVVPPANAPVVDVMLDVEGLYNVALSVRSDSGAAVRQGTKTRTIEVRGYLIVSVGDSVASGEGNPDVPGTGKSDPRWSDRQCHRSHFAGPAMAVERITSALAGKAPVSFLHVACSGAGIDVGLIHPYDGQEASQTLLPQIDQVKNQVGGRRIDALLISAGGNDAGFGDIAYECVLRGLFDACRQSPPGLTFMDRTDPNGLLDTRYDELHTAIMDKLGPDLSNDKGRIFITEYPDPTRRGANWWDPTEFSSGTYPCRFIGLMSKAEDVEWAEEMVRRLNRRVAAAATRHGWTLVGGIQDQFADKHGYCADSNWIVTASGSRYRQGNWDGTLHPNFDGQQAYADRISRAVLKRIANRHSLSVTIKATPDKIVAAHEVQLIVTATAPDLNDEPVTKGRVRVGSDPSTYGLGETIRHTFHTQKEPYAGDVSDHYVVVRTDDRSGSAFVSVDPLPMRVTIKAPTPAGLVAPKVGALVRLGRSVEFMVAATDASTADLGSASSLADADVFIYDPHSSSACEPVVETSSIVPVGQITYTFDRIDFVASTTPCPRSPVFPPLRKPARPAGKGEGTLDDIGDPGSGAVDDAWSPLLMVVRATDHAPYVVHLHYDEESDTLRLY